MNSELSHSLLSCKRCKREYSRNEWKEKLYICPHCGEYAPFPVRDRIDGLCDSGSFEELFGETEFFDPLQFPGYQDKFNSARAKSGEQEAVVCGTARIGGCPLALFVMNGDFMMGSMGSAVGDKLASLFEYAMGPGLPVIGFTVSGGARMQEGMLSLMQMAKVSAAVKRHSDRGLLYVAVATDPTMGGVTASFAMQGDIILAEPGARIGFAGKRVVEQVTGELLPMYFQTAEFQRENGFLDAIVPRERLKEYLTGLLWLHLR